MLCDLLKCFKFAPAYGTMCPLLLARVGLRFRRIASSLTKTSESSSGVEHHLAKVRVAGSNPVFRSRNAPFSVARMVELVDTLDLKSNGQQCPCGFKSRSEYR